MTLVRIWFLSIGVCGIAAAQTPADSTIQELLKEVRALRVAIEHSNQIGPRVQIALARMQAQEERVRTANRAVQDARERLVGLENRKTELGEQLKQLESMQNETTDPAKRQIFQVQGADIKHEFERLGVTEAQLRAKESEANVALLSEQARWNEADELLRGLEKLLTAQ